MLLKRVVSSTAAVFIDYFFNISASHCGEEEEHVDEE
jgi:hypothetical protein